MSEEDILEGDEEEAEVIEGDEILRERERLKALGLENASESAFDRISKVDPEKAEDLKEREEEKKSRQFVGFDSANNESKIEKNSEFVGFEYQKKGEKKTRKYLGFD